MIAYLRPYFVIACLGRYFMHMCLILKSGNFIRRLNYISYVQ